MAAITVEQVDAAIAECLLYKRTTINDRTFEYQDLEQLRALRAEVAYATKTGGAFSVAEFVPR